MMNQNSNRIIVPGYVDTHIHGAFGVDTCDGSAEAIVEMARRLPEFGVTAFCPTTMTVATDVIFKAFEAVSKAIDILSSSDEPYAKILGVHLEGPFINDTRAGVQDSNCIIHPFDGFNLIEKLKSDYPGLLKIVDIAPEMPGSDEFISEYKDQFVLSIAHSDADYDTSCKAFELGVKSVTHLLNAMPTCSKRNPGILGACFDNPNVFCEIICDGIHINPTILRMLFKLLNEDRIIIVSDSMRGSGMPDGIYNLGTVDVKVSGGRTFYGENGGLAGSVTNIAQEVERLYSYGISPSILTKAACLNPLYRLGLDSSSNKSQIELDDSYRFNTTVNV